MLRWKEEVLNKSFWRDVVAEFIGTFMLMTVQSALPLSWTDTPSDQPLELAVHTALGMGFIVCTMAWMCSDFGGGHFNPAVTISMASTRKITPIKGAIYVITQCVGTITGTGFIYGVTPANRRERLAATTLNTDVKAWQGVLIEAWITCILVLTIYGATNARRKGNLFMPTIPIGFAVTLGILAAYVSTGASMNPARSLGPAVVLHIWDDHWVYWIGPICGGLIASIIYKLLDMVNNPTGPYQKSSSSDDELRCTTEINKNVSEILQEA